ncbi:unnamed protein product, partial [marine sediment metagenome]
LPDVTNAYDLVIGREGQAWKDIFMLADGAVYIGSSNTPYRGENLVVYDNLAINDAGGNAMLNWQCEKDLGRIWRWSSQTNGTFRIYDQTGGLHIYAIGTNGADYVIDHYGNRVTWTNTPDMVGVGGQPITIGVDNATAQHQLEVYDSMYITETATGDNVASLHLNNTGTDGTRWKLTSYGTNTAGLGGTGGFRILDAPNSIVLLDAFTNSVGTLVIDWDSNIFTNLASLYGTYIDLVTADLRIGGTNTFSIVNGGTNLFTEGLLVTNKTAFEAYINSFIAAGEGRIQA